MIVLVDTNILLDVIYLVTKEHQRLCFNGRVRRHALERLLCDRRSLTGLFLTPRG